MCSATIYQFTLIRHGGQMTIDKSGFELPLRLSLQPSNWVMAVIYLSHFGALLCTYYSNIPMLPMQITCLMILSSLAYWYYRYIYQFKQTPVELLLNDKDEWYISEEGGDMAPAVLLPESLVHTHLIVLMFKQKKRNRCVILTSDNLPKMIFRRLSVRLRFTLSGARG